MAVPGVAAENFLGSLYAKYHKGDVCMDRNIFKVIRKARGYSQRELAAIMGVSYSLINHIETGRNRLTEKTAAKFMEACNVTAEDIESARRLIGI